MHKQNILDKIITYINIYYHLIYFKTKTKANIKAISNTQDANTSYKQVTHTIQLKTTVTLTLTITITIQKQMNSQSYTHQDNFVYQPPTQQQYQYQIFINHCSSYIASELVEQFRNDHLIEANPNIIIGSTQSTQNNQNSLQQPLPSGVDQIIDITNQRLYNSVLIKADIILFILNKNNIRELEYILKLLKNATLEKQKRIVCISSFLSWGKRKTNQPFQVNKESLFLRNSLDFHMKVLQDYCLAIHNENQKVKGSVIFSGLAYGLGQDSLLRYFKRALEQEKPLEIYGKGTNLIPTIHLRDLSQIVYNVAFKPFDSKKNWHFACDESKITQKQLISSISQNLGNGSTIQIPIEQCFTKNNYDQLTLDLEVHDAEHLSEWHCQKGFIEGIQFIVGEFNEYRGLKPNKILIIGPPVSGKTTIADILKKNYGLTVINIKSLIEDIKQDSTQFGQQLRTLLEQIKTQKVQEQRKIYEQMKKKKKGKGVEDFDPEKVVPRLPDQQLKKAIKWRLNFSDCLNKGYILDSVIKTYKMAESIFMNENHQINKSTIPNTVFQIKATDDQVKERVKIISPQKSANTHWNEEGTVRRLQTYSKQNEQKPLKSFFQEKVDIKEVQISYQDPQIFAQFVERNGPLGFKKLEQQASQSKQIKDEGADESNKNEKQEEQEQEDQEAQEERQVEQEFNLQKLTAKEQKILNEKSRPIRQYLIDNVIPQITEGLLQICKQVPIDPIQFLIGFLQGKRSKKKK